jgi:hypothetical protein
MKSILKDRSSSYGNFLYRWISAQTKIKSDIIKKRCLLDEEKITMPLILFSGFCVENFLGTKWTVMLELKIRLLIK